MRASRYPHHWRGLGSYTMLSHQLTMVIIALRSLLVELVRDASLLWRMIGDPMRADAVFGICWALICLESHNLIKTTSLWGCKVAFVASIIDACVISCTSDHLVNIDRHVFRAALLWIAQAKQCQKGYSVFSLVISSLFKAAVFSLRACCLLGGE